MWDVNHLIIYLFCHFQIVFVYIEIKLWIVIDSQISNYHVC